MFFKKEGYTVIKNIISKETSSFIFDYLNLRRKVSYTFFDTKYIDKNNNDFGSWNYDQVPGTFSIYGDVVMETLLLNLLPKIENFTDLTLYPTYSFARIYKKGDILKKHKDRISCEISLTLNLGGDIWPIYLKNKENKEIEVNLEQGDIMIYKGCELEHWRNEFLGESCGQVFLHYINVQSIDSEKNKFDGRPHLGLPITFKHK
jgi:hypothetical protein